MGLDVEYGFFSSIKNKPNELTPLPQFKNNVTLHGMFVFTKVNVIENIKDCQLEIDSYYLPRTPTPILDDQCISCRNFGNLDNDNICIYCRQAGNCEVDGCECHSSSI